MGAAFRYPGRRGVPRRFARLRRQAGLVAGFVAGGVYHAAGTQGSAAEQDLFARHTMLVVTARAVTDTIIPDAFQAPNRSRRNNTLTEGFAAWLLDAAGADGAKLLDDITSEISQYNWQHNSRDTLKDLYHAVIPRHIRHDFGEYYTPDWLARAVCEEVMGSAMAAGSH